jgi:seryl-tRNA synthetase
MLDIKIIRERPDDVRAVIERRKLDGSKVDVGRLLELDALWREKLQQADALRAERNQVSAQIKKLQADERKAAIERVKALKGELAELEQAVEGAKQQRDELLALVPNLLADDVPDGTDDDDNVEISRWGEPPAFDYEPRNHVELGALTDTIDFERGAKVAGAAFYYLKNEAALLEQALQIYASGLLLREGFVPVSTPDLARDRILEGIGFAPRGPETQIYSVENTDLSLVGTAEITVGGYHADEILDAEQLPLKYIGFSHCFRTEAGAHGKESRGLYRVHQFTKAEMFILCRPEQSAERHEQLRELEERLLQGLGIAYRVVNVCSGELGAPALKKYDIEGWMPGRGDYGEVTSCSNCTDYQARRLNIRFKEGKGSPQFVHMLNGTAIAISRTLLAIYENYQQRDGSIAIPEALHPYLPMRKIPLRR